MFPGAYTALITPFKDGVVDEVALRGLINYQCDQGIDGIVICGSTGEFFTLSPAEQHLITKIAVSESRGRVPIIVGVGHFTADHTIFLAQQAQENGAAALLIVTPPYLKPSGQALLNHYTTIHNHTNLPIILYDNPSRGSVLIPDDIVIALAQLPRIAGLKDASGDPQRPASLTPHLPHDFCLLSGDDVNVLNFMAQGGHGVISVSGNVIPGSVKQLVSAIRNKDIDLANKLNAQLLPLHQVMFCEPSPAAAKYACASLNLCHDEIRLPLLPLSQQGRMKVDAVMASFQLIQPLEIL